MPEVLQTLLKSRRFWASAASLAFIYFKPSLPIELTEEQFNLAVLTIVGWVIGESFRSSEAKNNVAS